MIFLEIGIVMMSLGIGFYTLGTVLFFDRTLYLMANVPLLPLMLDVFHGRTLLPRRTPGHRQLLPQEGQGQGLHVLLRRLPPPGALQVGPLWLPAPDLRALRAFQVILPLFIRICLWTSRDRQHFTYIIPIY